MDVNGVAVRAAVLQAVTSGIKRHFPSARIEFAENGDLTVRVLGLTFRVSVTAQSGGERLKT